VNIGYHFYIYTILQWNWYYLSKIPTPIRLKWIFVGLSVNIQFWLLSRSGSPTWCMAWSYSRRHRERPQNIHRIIEPFDVFEGPKELNLKIPTMRTTDEGNDHNDPTSPWEMCSLQKRRQVEFTGCLSSRKSCRYARRAIRRKETVCGDDLQLR